MSSNDLSRAIFSQILVKPPRPTKRITHGPCRINSQRSIGRNARRGGISSKSQVRNIRNETFQTFPTFRPLFDIANSMSKGTQNRTNAEESQEPAAERKTLAPPRKIRERLTADRTLMIYEPRNADLRATARYEGAGYRRRRGRARSARNVRKAPLSHGATWRLSLGRPPPSPPPPPSRFVSAT